MPRKAKPKDPADDVEDLLDQADELPPGPAKLAVFDEAIRLADSINDVELAFYARTELMGAALDVGRGDVLSVAFTWCLAKYDEQPQRFPDFDVYFAFRWAISELAPYPQFGRPQIETMIADMARRYRAIGASQRPVEYLRMNVSDDLGDKAMARAALTAARKGRRDWLADDPVSERGFEVRILTFMGREADALKKAEPFLSLKIRDLYDTTKVIANMLLPLLRRGRAEEGLPLYQWAVRACRGNPRHVSWYAQFIRFLALTGNLTAGLTLFRKHLADAFEWVNPSDRFEFCSLTPLLLDRLAESGRKTLKIKLPAALGVNGGGVVAVTDLSTRLRAEAAALAAQFDARNGNTYFSDALAEQAGLMKYATDCPLDAK